MKKYYLQLNLKHYPSTDNNVLSQDEDVFTLNKQIDFAAEDDTSAVEWAENWWDENSYDVSYAYECDCDLWRSEDNCIIYDVDNKHISEKNFKQRKAA